MARRRGQFTKGGFIAVWILGGIARQVKYDAKHGALNARDVFRGWVRTKWRRTSKWIRVPLFAIGITARTVYRAGHHSGRTLRNGLHAGITEGAHRHREWVELRGMQRDYPRDHPHYSDRLTKIRAERAARRDAHAAEAAHGRHAARAARNGKTIPPMPVVTPVPSTPDSPAPTPPVADPLVAPTPALASATPHHPGEPTSAGHWRLKHAADPASDRENLPRNHAEKLAAWWRWRDTQPGGHGGDVVVVVLPMGDRLEYFRAPDGELRFGATLDDPNGVKNCGHCGGTATVNGGTCPSCRARGDIRFADHQRRQAAAKARRVPPPFTTLSPTGKNTTNGGEPMPVSEVNCEAGRTIPEVIATYASMAYEHARLADEIGSELQAGIAEFKQRAAAFDVIANQLAAAGHDSETVNEAARMSEVLESFIEVMERTSAEMTAGLDNVSAQFAQAKEALAQRHAAMMEAAMSTTSNAAVHAFRE